MAVVHIINFKIDFLGFAPNVNLFMPKTRFSGPNFENPGPYDEISLKPGSCTSFPTIPLKKCSAAGVQEISRFEPQMVVDPVGGGCGMPLI